MKCFSTTISQNDDWLKPNYLDLKSTYLKFTYRLNLNLNEPFTMEKTSENFQDDIRMTTVNNLSFCLPLIVKSTF